MKRIVAIILCLLLLGALALSAAAAGSAHMSISSSNSTVYRGGTFTLTVNLSNDQPISNGAILLSYDSSVFELVGGSCNVSNATLAEVSAAKGGGVFMLQTDAVVSGTIFTIEMKVKSNAAFGSYTISGTPSLNIDCGISGTSITVECSHSFGKCTKVDGSNHESTCSICGKTKKEAHTWNSGTVTKAATCKDTGSKTLKCTACGAEKAETIPVTSDHKYGSWSSQGGSGHSRKCSVCGKEETAGHSWYIGEVIEAATCQSTGLATIICDGCGASAKQELSLTDHTYGVPINVTATEHTHKCSVCGTVTTEGHSFGEELEHDKEMHYYACEVCGYKKDQAAHTPGPKATEETDQVCTVCNRILKPKGAHQHEYLEEWSTDENNHWHDCVDCPARDTEMPHVFDSTCDVDCNVCGMTRQVIHQNIPTMASDETGHWYPCPNCGEKQDFSAHIPGEDATITSAQLCTVCQYEIAPVVPHDHIYNANGTQHVHKCVCGEEYAADAETCGICAEAHKQFPWWIICIAEAVVFGGVIIGMILFKKKKSTSADEYIPSETANPEEETGLEQEPVPAENESPEGSATSDEAISLEDIDALLSKFLAEEDADAPSKPEDTAE